MAACSLLDAVEQLDLQAGESISNDDSSAENVNNKHDLVCLRGRKEKLLCRPCPLE